MAPKRSYLDPVKHQRHIEYNESRRRAQKSSTAQSGSAMMDLLVKALDDPLTARKSAQRLLSDFGWAELGHAVYVRCKRILDPPGDPIRRKVVKGKPGRLNRRERVEYRNRKAVQGIMELVDGDA